MVEKLNLLERNLVLILAKVNSIKFVTVWILLMCTYKINCAGVQYSEETTKDVCNGEELDIRCGYSEVVIVTSALYGHLHQGRCIPRDIGHFGCQADVLAYVDGRCSGQRNCVISMPDAGLTALEPECAVGLMSFLKVTYICAEGKPVRDFCRVLPVQQTPAFFYAQSAYTAECIKRADSAYVTMVAEEGQKVKVILTDLEKDVNVSVVQTRYIIEETGSQQDIVFSENKRGHQQVEYTSTANTVTVILNTGSHNALVTYKATGCLEFTPGAHTWTQRNQDVLTVGCYTSDQTWTLTCRGTKWIGVIGNCTTRKVVQPTREIPAIVIKKDNEAIISQPALSKEIWITIISVGTIFSCGVVLLIGFICIKLAKRSYSSDKNYERCEMVPLDANLRPIRNGDINTRNWQQTMSSQGNNLTANRNMAARNNSSPLILMDQDLITINGIRNT